MTAQIPDTYIYHEDEYLFVASEPRFYFDPKTLGIEPESISSACWRGFWCTYEISNKGFVLKDLYIHTKDDKYPPINRSTSHIDVIDHVGISGIAGATSFGNGGYRNYKELSLPMDYTGNILIGRNFLNHYYLHLGYQRFYTYELLVEIVVVNGKIIKMFDRSEIAKLVREKIDATVKEFDIETDTATIIKQVKEENSIGDIWWLK